MPAVEGNPPGETFRISGVDLVYSGLSAWSPPFGEADCVEIDRQPVRAERNLNPNVDFTGRSIPSHAPRRIISTDPLQEYYETKSGTGCRSFRPGFSFGIILVSHDYRVVLMGLMSVSATGLVSFDISVGVALCFLSPYVARDIAVAH